MKRNNQTNGLQFVISQQHKLIFLFYLDQYQIFCVMEEMLFVGSPFDHKFHNSNERFNRNRTVLKFKLIRFNRYPLNQLPPQPF